MPWPVTFNGRTYTSNDFLNSSYVNGLPDLMQDAATHFANGYIGSSTTSLTIGTGNKTLTVEPNKLFGVGQPVVIASTASPATQYMDGRITAWNAGTGSMTVAVAALAGSGTLSAWTVTIGGARLSTTTIPVPVNEGGTGSTTSGGALTALGLSNVGQTLVAQATQALMRTTGLGITSVGDSLLTASTTAIQRTNLGSGTTGDALFLAATAAAARSTLGSGATGDAIFTAATAVAARTTLGAGATGDALFTAATAAAARTTLGAGTAGAAVFTSATTDDARTAIGAGTAGAAVFTSATTDDARTAIGMYNNAGNFTAPQRAALSSVTFAASLTLDFNTSNNFSIGVLTSNITLNNPTNQVSGQSGIIFLTQDATGGRTINYGTAWLFEGGVEPALSTGANARDALFYFVQSSGNIYCTLLRGFS